MNLGGFTSDRFLSPPSPRSIHNTGRGLRSFARVDFRATDPNHLNLVVTGDGVNFEIPMEERDVRLRPNFKNLQRARSQSAVFAWNHVRSSNLVVHTAAYERWSSVRQLPEAIDQYGAQTHAGSTVAISLVPRELEPRYSGRAAPTFSIFFSLQAARHQMSAPTAVRP